MYRDCFTCVWTSPNFIPNLYLFLSTYWRWFWYGVLGLFVPTWVPMWSPTATSSDSLSVYCHSGTFPSDVFWECGSTPVLDAWKVVHGFPLYWCCFCNFRSGRDPSVNKSFILLSTNGGQHVSFQDVYSIGETQFANDYISGFTF